MWRELARKQPVRFQRFRRPLVVACGTCRMSSLFAVGGKMISLLCFLILSEQIVAAKDAFTTYVLPLPVSFFLKNKQW